MRFFRRDFRKMTKLPSRFSTKNFTPGILQETNFKSKKITQIKIEMINFFAYSSPPYTLNRQAVSLRPCEAQGRKKILYLSLATHKSNLATTKTSNAQNTILVVTFSAEIKQGEASPAPPDTTNEFFDCWGCRFNITNIIVTNFLASSKKSLDFAGKKVGRAYSLRLSHLKHNSQFPHYK